MSKSCILKHFGSYAELEPCHEDLLCSLEKSPRKINAETVLCHEGDIAEAFYTVLSGWLFSYRNMEDGTRQVLDIFVPGDVIGLREFAFTHRLTSVAALTEAEVCEFPKSRMAEIFSNSVLLSSLFFAIGAREQAVLLERLVNLGRRSATQKLAHLTLELLSRLERTNTFSQNEFRMPLPQHVLADALGLSTVHVSRTFTELKEEGLMFRDNNHIQIPNIKRLKDFAGFSPYYLNESVPLDSRN
ncbi:Crp/Fnr family transcriptional regulator [Gilvimarinus chinensis]|uniref:Crp/Fnr family transcriptional regulator n=1 Tax=Gilvimarinus chinensis TaxID=396005 RepID=UPI00036BC6F4|nr:Crp/Fnr family transcriptional regulator [Gilvimarinus chinensis]